jgi:hypothetical protein
MSAKDFIKTFKINNVVLSSDAFQQLDRALKARPARESRSFVENIISKIEREHCE